jgi:hypothetical protein
LLSLRILGRLMFLYRTYVWDEKVGYEEGCKDTNRRRRRRRRNRNCVGEATGALKREKRKSNRREWAHLKRNERFIMKIEVRDN